MRHRGIDAIGALILLALMAGGLFARVAPAQALMVPVKTFGEPCPEEAKCGSGQLRFARPGISGEPAPIAIDQSTGALYVGDTKNNRVQEFTGSGQFVLMWGTAVNVTKVKEKEEGKTITEAEENVCTAASHDICGPGTPDESALGQGRLAEPVGIAVEPSTGDVVVSNNGTGLIERFTAEGEYLAQFGGFGKSAQQIEKLFTVEAVGNGVAADSRGDVFVASPGVEEACDCIKRFDAEGNMRELIDHRPAVEHPANRTPFAEAVGPGSELYVLDQIIGGVRDVAAFTPLFEREGEAGEIAFERLESGPWKGGVDPTGGATAIAVAPTAGDIYVVDERSSPHVFVYSPSGAQLDRFSIEPGLRRATGLAYAGASGELYIASSETNQIAVMGPAAPAAPEIQSESANHVSPTGVTLAAVVDPLRSETTYQFQIVSDATYAPGSPNPYAAGSTAPATPASLGEGFFEEHASTVVSALAPSTTYHYRLVATNVHGTTDGPDRTFTTYPAEESALLAPDGRGYELVSPLAQNGVDAASKFGPPLVQAAPSGEALVYEGFGNGFGHAEGAGVTSTYRSSRGTTAWESANVEPPLEYRCIIGHVCEDGAYRAFATDLSSGISASHELEGNFPPFLERTLGGYQSLLTRDFASGSLSELVAPPPSMTPEEFHLTFEGASPDAHHVVFATNADLGEAGGPEGGLYETSVGGPPALVGVLPGGEVAPSAGLGNPVFANDRTQGAVSSDGSRVFFTSEGRLYVRENGTRTVEVDESELEPGHGGGGEFRLASANGETVLFIDKTALTAQAVSGNPNLYSFNVATDALTNITPGPGANVQGVVGASEDARTVYFTNEDALRPGFGGEGTDVYVWHDGETKLVVDDTVFGDIPASHPFSETQEVTPDGGAFSFLSMARLDTVNFPSGYDNTDAATGHADNELYVYYLATGELFCASCDPSGQQPGSGGESGELTNVPPVDEALNYHPRFITDGGARVFFETPAPLTPRDTNDAPDVYEWERSGLGSCPPAARGGGCQFLISSGTDAGGSRFLDASASGEDVFLTSRQPLATGVADELVHVYDAHVCTPRHPCFTAPPIQPPPCGSADACKPPPSPQPGIFGSLASSTFSGAGNLPPTPTVALKGTTSAQQFSRALKACKAKPRKHRRACEAQARKRYATRSRSARTTRHRRHPANVQRHA